MLPSHVQVALTLRHAGFERVRREVVGGFSDPKRAYKRHFYRCGRAEVMLVPFPGVMVVAQRNVRDTGDEWHANMTGVPCPIVCDLAAKAAQPWPRKRKR